MIKRLQRGGGKWVAALTAGALLVAACGSDDDEASGASTTASATAATTADTTSGTDASPGTDTAGTAGTSPDTDVGEGIPADADLDATLRVAADLEKGKPTHFDPARYPNNPLVFTDLIYDTLLRLGPDGLEPGLAAEWSFPDRSTVEFTLREGLVFQDETPLDAEAVKFSFDRLIAATPEETGKIAPIAALESVEVVDDLSVRMHLSEPIAGEFRDSVMLTSQHGTGIVSPTAVTAAGGVFSDNPVGAGPYKVVEFVPGQKLVMERWDGYWNPDGQKVARIEFIHVLPGAPTVTALASGAADMAALTPAEVASVRSQGLTVEEIPRVQRATMYQFCVSRPPFDSLEARQAASHAIERQAYIDTAYQGLAEPNDRFTAPGFPFYPEDVENPYPYDLEKAKELLESAGLVGATVKLLVGPPSSAPPLGTDIAQIMQQQLNAVGFNTEIVVAQNSFAELPTSDWNIWLGSFSQPGTASAFIVPGGAGNACNYENPEVTAAFEQTRDPTLDEEATAAAWAEFQQAIYDDAATFNIASQFDLAAHTDQVEGIAGDVSLGLPWVWGEIYVSSD